MKYLLLGAGLQGTAIAFDLLRQAEGTTQLVVVDANEKALRALAERLDDPRLKTIGADVTDAELLGPVMTEVDVVISAVNYWFNADLAALAVENQAHFLDLGGNNDIVAREFELDERARQMGVSVVPDCGLAPGLAGILGYYLVDNLAQATSLKLRVGGLPAQPQPPMNYKIVFSVEGLINEYIEPAVVIRGGQILTVPSLTELESLSFPAPYDELEAFQTSGGTSTLPQTLLGRVPELDYKTIRYKGHCAQFRLLHELGLTDSKPLSFGTGEVSPRQMLARVMQESLQLPGEDLVLVLCEAEGQNEAGQTVKRSIRIIDHHDRQNNITAMMRMTGYPVAIVANMLATGEVKAPGAQAQEKIIPGDQMIARLKDRGIAIEEFETS